MPDQDISWWGTQDPSQPSADKDGPSEERASSSAVLHTEPLLATVQDPLTIGSPSPAGGAQQAAPSEESTANSRSTRSGALPLPFPPAALRLSHEEILELKVPPKQEILRQDVPANVWLPQNLVVTFYEIMAFLPSMLQLPQVMLRMRRNKAKYELMAKVQLWAWGKPLTAGNNKKIYDRLKQQGKFAMDAVADSIGLPDSEKNKVTSTPHNDLTPRSWRTRDSYGKAGGRGHFGHVLLRDLWKNVDEDRWPKGKNRGQLTQCLELDRQQPELKLYTSHLPWILGHIVHAAQRQPSHPHINTDQEDIASWEIIDWDGVLAGGDVIQAEPEDVSATRVENDSGQSSNIANVARVTEDRAQSFVDNYDSVEPGPIETFHQIMANFDTYFEKTRLIPYIRLDYNFSRDDVHNWLEENTWDQSKLFRLQYWLTSRRIPVDAAVLRLLQDACYGRLQRG